ncbi:MAG: hypothetical protein PHP83_02105 [Clostridia bacterium]|nr:hypothetical protein [Clostridia bacterium]
MTKRVENLTEEELDELRNCPIKAPSYKLEPSEVYAKELKAQMDGRYYGTCDEEDTMVRAIREYEAEEAHKNNSL